MSIKTFEFHVSGMHCSSCVYLIEENVAEDKRVKSVKADLANHRVSVTGDFAESPEAIAPSLTERVRAHGYALSAEKRAAAKGWGEFKTAIPVALGFIALFIILQKLGIVNLVGGGEMTYGTAFLIGLVASVSTCMAVVGGIVLSMSASFAKTGDKVKPQIMFHASRLISFFVLGGVIGLLGSTFRLEANSTFVLGLVVGLVMLILGLNLLDVFPWARSLQPKLPGFITRHVTGLKNLNHTLTPILLGALTFILPCGFTQSVQIYALSLGSFAEGALTMLAFALGTLPVLALLSFGAAGIHDKIRSGIFFKSAGLVVIFFALLNILTAFVGRGIIPPLFNL